MGDCRAVAGVREGQGQATVHVTKGQQYMLQYILIVYCIVCIRYIYSFTYCTYLGKRNAKAAGGLVGGGAGGLVGGGAGGAQRNKVRNSEASR